MVAERERWIEFVSERLRAQISLENREKAETWGLGLLALATLGWAFDGILSPQGTNFIYAIKLLFLLLFHAGMILAFYLPAALEKGKQSVARLFGLRDFTSLALDFYALWAYALVTLALSFQVARGVQDMETPGFFAFVFWANFVLVLGYVAACFLGFCGYFFFPAFIARSREGLGKLTYLWIGLHAAFAFLFGFAYADETAIGSTLFFSEFRVAALFWIFIFSSLLFIAKALRESLVPAFQALELDVAAGKLDRSEDVLARLKEATVPSRFSAWVQALGGRVARHAEEIAHLAQDAVSLVNRESLKELDIRQVEERYKKALAISRRLEREHQRFLLTLALVHLGPAEKEKADTLGDQFSRAIRNGNLELASVRKQIDDRLVAIKNKEKESAPHRDVPVEKIGAR